MKRKSGLCLPIFILVLIAAWVANCHVVPQPKVESPTGKPMVSSIQVPVTQNSGNGHENIPPATITKKVSSLENSSTFQRNKRDTANEEGKSQFSLFPVGARNADDAYKKLLMILALSKQKPAAEEYDEDDDYEDDIELFSNGREPGSKSSSRKMGSRKKNAQYLTGEDPTGPPIVIYQHRLNKKSAPTTHVIPEIFLREAATSSRTQPDPKIMRKLLERIGFSRQLR